MSKAKFIKINNYEYERSRDFISSDITNKIIRTKGGDGCSFRGKIYPVNRVDVKDTSGAGDTFFAALVGKYAQTEDIETAIKFANECAARVVQQRGVSTIDSTY